MLGGTNAWCMAKAPYGVTGKRAEELSGTLWATFWQITLQEITMQQEISMEYS